MKQYQVTSKRQVTIPKHLAEKKGIKPGDSVLFEETQEGIILKRVTESDKLEYEALQKIITAFMTDVPVIRKHLRKSRRAISENFSRHLRSK
ncbi:MAG: AbrB/MazE/SpoVT family DNA-binding domain-containing protein [Nitrososphaerales archaeon]